MKRWRGLRVYILKDKRAFIVLSVTKRTVNLAIWAIKVFESPMILTEEPDAKVLASPSLQASDVTDVEAEFVADPFMMFHKSKYYLFFEVLDRSTGKGVIGLAISNDGKEWHYDRIVLRESYHLSYPYIVETEGDIFMLPESTEAGRVLLYKATNFPYDWVVSHELIEGSYLDASVFEYDRTWWMLAGTAGGNLHLFFSDSINGRWTEHPSSPMIVSNFHITRPAGRVIAGSHGVYRYAQDSLPYYGTQVRVFEITRLSRTEYEERELNTIIRGSEIDADWRKDGMHHIDQLKIKDHCWCVAVDGHYFRSENYLKWRFKRFIKSPISDLRKVYEQLKKQNVGV
ncbi:glucosamine inositolphosphorylceramide transferase family protein [Cohnella kolymensis]|uniref:glucosamine inositolphosphorylceramide transferase family protein n=1 Tax=Cohnella kolymensis TaxID=1590652 RepID=UPI00126A457E|nr:hypothetical protein [Cohnella kolymensis]